MRVQGSGASGSLMMAWAEAVLQLLGTFVDWPVRSMKLDDLSGLYVARQARDDCRLNVRLSVSRAGGGVTTVNVTSGAAPGGAGARPCVASLMVRPGVTLTPLGGAPAAAVTASTADGVRTLAVPVPPGGSVLLQIGGAPSPWLLPRVPRRATATNRRTLGG
jgi:hypothetical protein